MDEVETLIKNRELIDDIDKDDVNSSAIYRKVLMNPLLTHRRYGGTNVVVV